MAGVVIYVPIKYAMTEGCPKQYGMQYFIFSSMITVVIGTVMGFITAKVGSHDDEMLAKDWDEREAYILEKFIE